MLPSRAISDWSEPLFSAFADPDMVALRQKVNEMSLNGRR
jgi:hypothetical protein